MNKLNKIYNLAPNTILLLFICALVACALAILLFMNYVFGAWAMPIAAILALLTVSITADIKDFNKAKKEKEYAEYKAYHE